MNFNRANLGVSGRKSLKRQIKVQIGLWMNDGFTNINFDRANLDQIDQGLQNDNI